MPLLRLALAQVNSVVGDLEGNRSAALEAAEAAAAQGVDLLVLPELVLAGYPIEDLALRRSFQQASRSSLELFTQALVERALGGLAVVVGYLDSTPDAPAEVGLPAGRPRNAAAFVHQGRVVARYAKHHLPNYGVFDEARYFVPGLSLSVVRLHGVDVATAICEDLWQEGGPVATTREARAGLLVVPNASPYERNKDDSRLALVQRRAAEAGCALAYVNTVGGQDELVFDGDSVVVGPDGAVLARAPQFEPALLVVDLDLPAAQAPLRDEDSTQVARDGRPVRIERRDAQAAPRTSAGRPARTATVAPRLATSVAPRLATSVAPRLATSVAPPLATSVAPRLADRAEVWGALVVGLRDYVGKNGFRSVVLGLSGGIDSAVVASIAVDALGADAVHGVSLPSSYSSDHSRDDAADLAARTGLHYSTVAIAPMVEAYLGAVHLRGLAEENLQARVRGTTLMGLSNQHGHLVLATGNKSELAVGYSTLYGDAVGGYAPIKDVPKTLVWDLARWRNADAAERGQVPPIPENSIDKEPSAELRPDQRDTDSLPPYDLLDALLDAYVERDLGSADLVAAGFDAALVERVLRMVDAAEYKRRQYPPGPKISVRNFGRDRRLPITSRWREPAPGASD